MRLVGSQATPHRTGQARNRVILVIHMVRAPKRCMAQPDITITAAVAGRYPVVTHWIGPASRRGADGEA